MVNKPDSFRGERKKELLADNREDSYDKGQPADTKEHLRTNEVGDSGIPAALATGVEAPVAMNDKRKRALGTLEVLKRSLRWYQSRKAVLKKQPASLRIWGGATTKLMVITKQILTPEEMKKDWERMTLIRAVGGCLIQQTIITISKTEIGTQGCRISQRTEIRKI